MKTIANGLETGEENAQRVDDLKNDLRDAAGLPDKKTPKKDYTLVWVLVIVLVVVIVLYYFNNYHIRKDGAGK